jgi:rod shape determining protein RodA
VGSVGLLLILGFLIVRTLMIAVRAKDVFSRLVALGVACWFTVQIFENVGMNLGIMPVTGLPLPFVSYGGSSMFACWLALGLVNNAHLSGLYEQRKR